MSEPLLRAAQIRAAAPDRTRNDRPSQRRCAERADSRALVRAPAKLDLRAAADGGSGWDFEGIASVVERGYPMWDWAGEYTEVIGAGAFDESLARADLDVPLVLDHDSLRRIARTTNGSLSLSLNDAGDLQVLAPNLDPTDADVAYIAPKLRAGLIDEMSFAFRIEAGQWSPDYTEYRITKVNLHRGDVAIVGYGANPYTSSALRSAPAADIRAAMLAAAIGVRP